MRILTVFFIFIFIQLVAVATPPAAIDHRFLEARPSQSWQYSSEIVEFYRNQNRKSNESHFNKSNPIYKRLLETPLVTKDASIVKTVHAGDQVIELHEKGKGAGILIYTHGVSSTFIKKEDLNLDSGNAGVEIQDIRLTENNKFLEILIQTQGAITFYEYRLIDLAEKKIVLSLSRIHTFPAWNENGDSFNYTLWKGPDQYLMTHRMGDPIEHDQEIGIEPISFDLIPNPINKLIYFDMDTDSGRVERIKAHDLIHPNGVVVQAIVENILVAPDKESQKILVHADPQGVIEEIFSDEPNRLFAIKYKWGARSWVTVYDFSGTLIQKLEFPPGIFPVGVDFESGLVRLKIQSVTGATLVIKKDFKSGEWLDENNLPTQVNSELGRLNNVYHQGIWHSVEIEEILTETHDSEQTEPISTLLIKKSSSSLNGSTPTLIKFYGGFGLDVFRPSDLWPEEVQFILDGGILAQTGLRGGSEKGNNWHADGAQENKMNSALDLISVANDLVSRKYTQASQIAILGTSNGGLVAGSALVISPESFGLVIAVNGVLNPLSAQWLDAPYYGWAFEYGSFFNGNIRSKMMEYDPYFNITEREYPAVLAVVGLQDDRVAAAHSFKFIAKLQENQVGGAPILMTAIKNAGHHPGLSHHQAIRRVFNARVWTMIYQTIFENPKDSNLDLQFDPE